MALFSVIVTVYERQDELRRALQSVADQTVADFECIVVDDASTICIESVVKEFDERFAYVRRETNGGPTAARLTGCERATGAFLVVLDSDNELLPWALMRAERYFAKYPQVDGVIGLYLFPDGLRVRVSGGEKIFGPDDYRAQTSPHAGSDSVGFVRRRVSQEWLSLRRDYYNMDLAFLLQLLMFHKVVMVDEPWGRYNVGAKVRMTDVGRRDPRRLEDIRNFVRDYRPLIGVEPCGPIDVMLVQLWIRALRARKYEDAAVVAQWMAERGISRHAAVRRKLAWWLGQRLAARGPGRVEVV